MTSLLLSGSYSAWMIFHGVGSPGEPTDTWSVDIPRREGKIAGVEFIYHFPPRGRVSEISTSISVWSGGRCIICLRASTNWFLPGGAPIHMRWSLSLSYLEGQRVCDGNGSGSHASKLPAPSRLLVNQVGELSEMSHQQESRRSYKVWL